jgi:hypothetical protein
MPEGRGPMAVSPGQVVLDPRTGQPIASVPAKPDTLSPEAERQKVRIAQESRPQTTINNNVGEGQSEFAKRAQTTMANRYDKLATSAQAAAGNASNFQMLRELNKLAPTGPLQGRLAELMPNATTASAAFTAIVNQIAPTLRVEGSGATSDMEMNLFMQGLPRLRNTPQANEALIGFMERKAQLDVQRGTIAQRALRNEIPPAEAERMLEQLNSVSILTPEIRGALGLPEPQQQGAPQQPQAGPPAPAPQQQPSQAAPMQEAPQPPQQAPQQAMPQQAAPQINIDAIEAEIMRRQQMMMQQQQQQQSQMGVSP